MDLYALPPEQFTAARDAAAKHDPSLKVLRRPTVSAWVVNTLVRRDSSLLDELVALGTSLAVAQQEGHGDVLRQLVDAVTQRAVDLVGRDVSATVRGEVTATLEAALADPASAAAIHTGQLVRPLCFAGFGGVDLEGPVAPLPRPSAVRGTTAPASKAPPRKPTSPDTSVAEAVARQAAGALDDAVRLAGSATRAVHEHDDLLASATTEEHAAAARVHQARDALRAAEQEQAAARRRRTGVEREREALVRKARAATKAVATAQTGSDAARQALDRLRRAQ